ncbi:hypothetical protein [Desulfonatronum thiosulfatophilum]|nr:hypothetical protein [Desulfonatronum thiosulfatophilum]
MKLSAIFEILGLGVLQLWFGLQLSILLCLVFFILAMVFSFLVE